jgi:hypothetical protein
MSLLGSPISLAPLNPSTIAANTCYFPNGTPSTDEPCDPDALFTQCCGSRSACLTNGLCSLEATNITGIEYARGTCTDKTWGSSLCPQQCQLNQHTPKRSSAYDFRANGVQVWECGSQGYAEEARYCCESEGERQRCCSTSSVVFTLQGAIVGASTSATTTPTFSSSSSAKASTSGPTATNSISTNAPTATPTIAGQPREANNTKAAGIGAGVGGAVASMVLIAVIVFFIRRHRRAKRNGVVKGHPVEVWTQPAEVWTQPHELPSLAQPAWELSGDPIIPRVS